MMRMTIISLLVLFLLIPGNVLADDIWAGTSFNGNANSVSGSPQTGTMLPGTVLAPSPTSNDSLLTTDPKYNNKLMAIDLVLLTVGVWAPSRILGTDWAYIGFNTVKENMKTGFVWDHDDWAMNQWGHPIHGGQFFNAARTNGYDFW